MQNNPHSFWVRGGQLLIGLACYGISIALMIKSQLGLGPWDMFHQGLSLQTGLSVGRINQIVGFVILSVLVVARIRLGIGTVLNIFMIGAVTDLVLPWLPSNDMVLFRLAIFGLGVFVCGLGTGLYIGAQMGAGPRDSLMIWLHQRTGWPIRRVRTLMELIVLVCGWLLGGTIGVGTLLYAFGIGPAAQFGLSLFDRRSTLTPASEAH